MKLKCSFAARRRSSFTDCRAWYILIKTKAWAGVFFNWELLAVVALIRLQRTLHQHTHTQSRNNLKSFKSWVSIANLLWQLPAKHYGNIHCVRVLDYWANIWPMSEAKMCVWHWMYGVRMVLSARFMWLKWLTRYAQFELTHTRVLWYPIRVAYANHFV